MTWPNAQQLTNTFTSLRAAMTNLERDAATLIHRAKIDSRDGYPRSSGRARDGGQTVGGHSDPVADLICSDPMRDEVHAIVTNMCRQLEHATIMLLAADQSRARAFPPEASPDAQIIGLPQCANPHCDELATPRRAGRCEACYRYRLRNSDDAPEHVVIERTQRRVHVTSK